MKTLLTDIERFLSQHQMAPSTFGAAALGDRHFVRQLRFGRRVFSETEEKVRDFMRTYSPIAAPVSPGKSNDLTAAQQSEAA